MATSLGSPALAVKKSAGTPGLISPTSTIAPCAAVAANSAPATHTAIPTANRFPPMLPPVPSLSPSEVNHFRAAFTLLQRDRGRMESMDRPIVILSPHLDDAVLSCWRVLEGPGEVEVVNVFAGVPPAGSATGWWDRASGSGDSARAVMVRIEEDRAALAAVGRHAVNLDFLDAQYRQDGADGDALAAAMRDAVPRSALVYVPAAFA